MSECMTQEDAMNMSDEQAVQILKPLRDMMIDQNGCPISDAVFALDKAIAALSKKMPNVDAVEVVRCKDCKRWNPAFDREVSEYGVCQIYSQRIATKRDFFCSKGERRSDG